MGGLAFIWKENIPSEVYNNFGNFGSEGVRHFT